MSYGLEYRSEWLMMDDANIVRVSIFDTDTITDDPPTIVSLTPGGNPLVISVIDNDRDKYKPIKSKQAKIEVLTSSEVGFETFADGSDNKYYVEIRINPDGDNKALFIGYLSLADNQEDFLPDPNVLVLTATDHLGMLKDIPLTTSGGLNPSGKSKMIDYLSWSLRKTGYNLPIYVVNNLRHGMSELTAYSTFSFAGQYIVISGITEFFYIGQNITITGTTSNNGSVKVTNVDNTGLATVVYIDTAIVSETATAAVFTDDSSDEYFYNHYIDAKTFEDDIGTCENCYSVIEKILGYDCFVTQFNGAWWIFRIDEWDENQIYVTEYDYAGAFVSFHDPTDYNISLGRDETVSPRLADWLLTADRPYGMTKLTYNFELPREIPCNNDFERGDLIGDDGTEVVDEVTYIRKKYELDCWDKLWSSTTGDQAATIDIEVKRLFNEFDYEDSRYINFPQELTGKFHFIRSEAIPVTAGDKMTVDITRSLKDNISGTSVTTDQCLQVRLTADDGTYWTHHGRTSAANDYPRWRQCAAGFEIDDLDLEWYVIEEDLDDDQRLPVNLYDGETAPFPKDGTIQICVFASNLYRDDTDTRIHKIDFEYIPKINGTFAKFKGQHQKVTRTPASYFAKIDDTVYISDSPKPILKGGIFRQIDTYTFVLCKTWYPYNVFPGGLAGHYDSCHPYGEVQIRSVFNQYRNANRIFTGTINGLNDNWPDMIYKYSITDLNFNTNGRYFMLSSFEQNWKSGFMSGTWVEVWQTPGKGYTEDREFKYISQ